LLPATSLSSDGPLVVGNLLWSRTDYTASYRRSHFPRALPNAEYAESRLILVGRLNKKRRGRLISRQRPNNSASCLEWLRDGVDTMRPIPIGKYRKPGAIYTEAAPASTFDEFAEPIEKIWEAERARRILAIRRWRSINRYYEVPGAPGGPRT
jgi:hypothetical protein